MLERIPDDSASERFARWALLPADEGDTAGSGRRGRVGDHEVWLEIQPSSGVGWEWWVVDLVGKGELGIVFDRGHELWALAALGAAEQALDQLAARKAAMVAPPR